MAINKMNTKQGGAMNHMKLLERLKAIALSPKLEEDYSKFLQADKSVDIAGTRVRNAMQDLKKLAQDIRTAVQAVREQRKK